jgi:AraC-like DNA-binding protein
VQPRRALSGINASRVVLLPLIAQLDADRVDTRALLAGFGLSKTDLDNPELRMPREIVGDVWRAAVAQTGDPTLGLRVAAQMQPGMLGLLEYAARSGASLGQALATLARYAELLAEGLSFTLEQQGGRARVIYALTGNPQPPALMDFALGYLSRLARQFTQPPVQLLEVSFDHPAPIDRAPYDAFFDTRLRFDAKQSSILFDAAYLEARVQSADPNLHAVLSHQASKLVSELPKGDSFEARVKRLIASELRSGDPTAQGLAKKLHMSPRTFQRRLLDAGTTHSKLLDDVRHTTALRLLDQEELSLGEIAATLGFSDVSAFRKAFKRWTGASPRPSAAAGKRPKP